MQLNAELQDKNALLIDKNAQLVSKVEQLEAKNQEITAAYEQAIKQASDKAEEEEEKKEGTAIKPHQDSDIFRRYHYKDGGATRIGIQVLDYDLEIFIPQANQSDVSIQFNGVNYNKLTEAPVRREPIARASTSINMNGHKK